MGLSVTLCNCALQKAAARAERHAVLDTARPTLERVLNYPHPPELLPWGAAMSTSYLFSYSTWYRFNQCIRKFG